ncbi:MAG: hypothetical protein JWM34_3747 [Ilumatobacteraceae bacterium]|nr:hypothetical protein [Ilumatobacteraceae bacterium]
MTQLVHRSRQLLGCLALIALVAGVPAVLAQIAGWPLPHRLPTWSRFSTAVQQGDIPANTVIRAIAVLVWIAWLQLMWALIWELVVNVPRVARGQRTVSAPMVPQSVGNGMGRLVALILSIGIIASSSRTLALAPASTTPLPHRTSAVAALVTETPSQRQAPTSVPVASRWHVAPRDSLWSIAEAALGDGSRVHEIIDLNPTVNSPRDIRSGMILTLPRDATVPADRQQVTSANQPVDVATPDAAPSYAPESTITVVRGDTLWDLSETELETAGIARPSGRDVVEYVHEVVAANPIIAEPNLIYPGQQFVLPAIGQPPPAQPAADAPAADAPAVAPTESPPGSNVPPTIETAPVVRDSSVPTSTVDEESSSTTALPPVPTATSPVTTEPTPSTTSVDRAAANAATAATADVSTSDSTVGWLAGISGSTVLASALVVAHRRRRTRQATRGSRLALRHRPEPAVAHLERSLVTAADIALVTWANHQLLGLLERIDHKRIAGGPVAVELSETAGIELLWDQRNPTTIKPWTSNDGGWTWRIPYDPDELFAANGVVALPSLASIGTRQGNQLLIDLEAFGSISIGGDPGRVDDFVRSLVLELGNGDLLSDTYIHVVEHDLTANELSPRVQVRHAESALTHLRQMIEANRELADTNQAADTFRLRVNCGPLGHETTIVVVPANEALVDDFVNAVSPRSGGIVIVIGEHADSAATISLPADGTACLQPLGLAFDAAGVPTETIALLDALASDTGHDIEVDEPAPAETDATSARDERRSLAESFVTDDEVEQLELDMLDCDGDEDQPRSLPEPGLLVRLLGAPTLPDHPQLGRLDVSLVAFLACHDHSATEDQVINAVWGGRHIERSTLWNRISKARSTLGPFLPGRGQSSQLVRLSKDAVTDLDLFRSLAAHATQVSSSEALELIEQAMDMIVGVPFDAPGYDWAYDHQYFAQACNLIESTALRGIDIALEANHPEAARRIATAALRALKADEPIYRARMRIEAHVGNLTGVRGAYNELAGMLSELAEDDSYQPSNSTKSLLGQLVGTSD